MTKQELINRWKHVGSPDANEIDTTTFGEFADKALKLFKGKVFNYTFRSLTTVADTAEYDLPATTINAVLYTYDTSNLSNVISTTTQFNGDTYSIVNSFPMSGVSIWVDMYLLEEIKLLQSQLKTASKKEIIRIQNSKLRVIPTPTDVHYINYVTKDTFTFATVTEVLEPILDNLYCAEQLMYLATKRMAVNGVTVGGSLVNYPGDKLVSLSKEYRSEADKLIKYINDKITLFL